MKRNRALKLRAAGELAGQHIASMVATYGDMGERERACFVEGLVTRIRSTHRGDDDATDEDVRTVIVGLFEAFNESAARHESCACDGCPHCTTGVGRGCSAPKSATWPACAPCLTSGSARV